MTSAVAQSCLVPIRTMELLSRELRLLKGAVDQLHARLELLLAEIADPQCEHEAGKEELVAEIQPDSNHHSPSGENSDVLPCPEPPDTALLLSASPELDASSEEIQVAISVADGPSAPVATAVCPDPLPPILGTDAAKLVDEASAQANSRLLEHSETPAIQAAPPSVARLTEIASQAVAVAQLPADGAEAACALAEPPSPSVQSCNVIVPDERRKEAPQKYPTTVRTVGRWAAAVALIALLVAVAAAGTGFAGFGELFTLKVSPGIPF